MNLVTRHTCGDLAGVKKCAEMIDNGQIIIYPTDTVYGLGCDATNDSSVLRLYQLKKRPIEKHLPVLTSDSEQISKLVNISEQAKILMNYFWPGQLTIIMKLKEIHTMISKHVFNSELGTIALRIPSNICTTRLINFTKNKLLVGTSANLSQQSPINDPNDLINNPLAGYDVILDGGRLGNSNSGVSTIIDISNPDKLIMVREGLIPREKIVDVLGIYGYRLDGDQFQ